MEVVNWNNTQRTLVHHLELRKFAADRFVQCKFNVASAPNWGGMGERLVSCVKNCLKKTIGLRQITYIELQTLVSGVEVILNNRPLVVLTWY